jgi:hypothetical protein
MKNERTKTKKIENVNSVISIPEICLLPSITYYTELKLTPMYGKVRNAGEAPIIEPKIKSSI